MQTSDPPTQPVGPQYVITSAYRTLTILRAFATPPHRFSLSELTGVLGLDKGQTYRSLKTLEEAGFVRSGPDGRLSLTPLLHLLSAAAGGAQGAPFAEVAAPVLNRLAQETGETVHLFARAGDRAVCIGIRESRHPVRLSASLGASAPLHAGASPKAMLAFLPEGERERVLAEVAGYPRYTEATVLDAAQLREVIGRVRRDGYAVSDEDVDVGARGVGAPIFDLSGAVVGALSVGGPSPRVGDAQLEAFGRLIVEGARTVSRALGYAGSEKRG